MMKRKFTSQNWNKKTVFTTGSNGFNFLSQQARVQDEPYYETFSY